MESTANLKRALRMRSRSAKAQIALTYAGFKSTSSIAARLPFGMDPAAVSCSITFMMAGGAEPPNLALNFTPFQFHGLWLEVTTTPPAVSRFLTAKEMAGVVK